MAEYANPWYNVEKMAKRLLQIVFRLAKHCVLPGLDSVIFLSGVAMALVGTFYGQDIYFTFFVVISMRILC